MDSVQLVRRSVEGLPRVEFWKRWNDPRIAGRHGQLDVRYVVAHHTAIPSQSMRNGGTSLWWLSSGGSHPPVPGSNYLIARDGTVHVLSGFETYHAGRGSGYEVPNNMMNLYSLGIEVESPGIVRDFTSAQIDSFGRLVANIQRLAGLGPGSLIEHEDWSTTGKVDTRYTTRTLRRWVREAEARMSEDNDYGYWQDKDLQPIRSNTKVVLDIDGDTTFGPEHTGSGVLATYANVKLPAAGSVERAALERGMVRMWFEEPEAGAEPDTTGLDNCRRVGLWGNRRLTMSHVWPHKVREDRPWRFCFLIEAFGPDGEPMDVEMGMFTRQGKVVGTIGEQG